jgi:hypothetical protein
VEIADIGGIDRAIVFWPEDFAGVEFIDDALEKVHASLTNFIALAFPVLNLTLIKLVRTIFDQA